MTQGQGKSTEYVMEGRFTPIGVYMLFGPLAVPITMWWASDTAPFDLSASAFVLFSLMLFFTYAFGLIPAMLVGLISASIIRFFAFWHKDSWMKFLFLGPLLGATFSLATAYLLFGIVTLNPPDYDFYLCAGLSGAMLGSAAYGSTL